MKAIPSILLALLVIGHRAANATEETFELQPFGTVTLYHNSPQPSHVVLFSLG